MLSPATLFLFHQLLDDVSVPAKADNFEEAAAIVATAKKELAAALEATAEEATAEKKLNEPDEGAE